MCVYICIYSLNAEDILVERVPHVCTYKHLSRPCMIHECVTQM